MIIFLVFFLTIFFAGLQYRRVITTNYITQDQTRIVNGLFVMLVFMTHFSMHNESDFLYFYLPFRDYASQLVVTPFLFFSGYGIFRSLHMKGEAYIKSFPQRRIMPFLLNAWIPLCFFIAYRIFVRDNVPNVQDLLLAFCFLKSLGNSTWYIFAMLYSYIALYIVAYFCYDKKWLTLSLFACLLLLYILLLNTLLKEWTVPHWYNTIFALWAGSLLGAYKEQFDSFLFPLGIFSRKRYLLLCIVTLAMFLLSHHYLGNDGYHIYCYEIASVTLPLLFVLLNIQFRFESIILDYLGQHVFSIYFLQRLCFTEFRRLGYLNNQWLYFAFSLIGTLAISYIFDKLIIKLPYNKLKTKA